MASTKRSSFSPALNTSAGSVAASNRNGVQQVLNIFLITIALVGAIYGSINTLLPQHAITSEVNAALSSPTLWIFVLIGLVAQTVDGALGMAYGVTATSLLMAQGIPPAAATTVVHLSEVFTTGFSGLSHYKLGNFNRSLFLRLLIPGSFGALAGAWFVSEIDGKALKPWVSAYLLLMGFYILYKAYRAYRHRQLAAESKITTRKIAPLALFGGFVDSVGGGGWGPVVTTTLIGRGHAPRTTIGSVNAAEFFLTVVSATAFAMLIGFGYWTAIVGLILGGLLAAPFAAWLCQRLSTKQLLLMVGLLIVSVSTFNLWKALA